MLKLVIRKARIADHHFIATAQVAMALETENLKLDPDTVNRGVMAILNDSHKGEYYIAELDDEPVGSLLTIPEWSDWRNGTVLWIHSVYVIPPLRGSGVYRQLYHHLQEKVKADVSLRGLRLYVDKTNHKAQAVYEKLGMHKEHYDLFEWMKTF